ncbi:DUF2242 domain-containing protein [Paraburkholderia ferrariae]|uniref:DUF2242 domain-containing protein n=1 Tax=Paraburkholderia ferrariae TaxID=386056 RepID=UPI0007C7B9C7|nr:DUF2242 domain-containing protein [Paraburkholderia ferrariae]
MSRLSRVAPYLPSPLAALAATVVAAAVVGLGACSSAQPKFQDDQLLSTAPNQFSRGFNYPSTDACESARRALLSQGYMTTMPHSDTVDASKDFQPAVDSHIVVEVHAVCTPGDSSNTSMVYVNAVQSGYALKKSDTSASVGLSILGSVSLPIRSNSDSMVKISSETIQSSGFYDRFFELVGRYLATAVRSEPVPGDGSIKITPLPPVTTPATPPATVPTTIPATMPATAVMPAPATVLPGAPANVVAVHPAALPVTPGAEAAQTPVAHSGAATGVALPVPVAPGSGGDSALPAPTLTPALTPAASPAAMTTSPAPAQAAAEPPLLASGTTTLASAAAPAANGATAAATAVGKAAASTPASAATAPATP